MKKLALILVATFSGVCSNSLLSESEHKSGKDTDKKYFQDALECQKNAQVSHELKLDVGQSIEAIKIPSGIDPNLFSVCMKNFGHEVNIKEDKFLVIHDICEQKALAHTTLKKQNNKLYIEAPDSTWYEECYQSGGITIEVIE